MHLLVPGAYRPRRQRTPQWHLTSSQCTFWCRVLTDRENVNDGLSWACLNAPSGAGCLPTEDETPEGFVEVKSQCTFWCRVLTDNNGPATTSPSRPVSMHLLVPGAYRLANVGYDAWWCVVSMHLLVPGAYRPRKPCATCAKPLSLNAPSGAGCLPTIMRHLVKSLIGLSQCTFWCRVLTDRNAAYAGHAQHS